MSLCRSILCKLGLFRRVYHSFPRIVIYDFFETTFFGTHKLSPNLQSFLSRLPRSASSIEAADRKFLQSVFDRMDLNGSGQITFEAPIGWWSADRVVERGRCVWWCGHSLA